MFEIEVLGLRRWRLRLGRWHFRTWRPAFMRLPRGYRSPEFVYEVASFDAAAAFIDHVFAAFGEMSEAEKLIEQLKAENESLDLVIRYIPVHASAKDWQFDR